MDLNHQPAVYETAALPLELLVLGGGGENRTPTVGMQSRRAATITTPPDVRIPDSQTHTKETI